MKPELINSLKGYKKEYIIPDILSGLLVAIIALPLSIALGIQSVPDGFSGSAIQMGIITAIVAGFFISAVGGSRFQIGGPTAAFAVILCSYIANPDIGVLGLQFATVFAGVLLIVLGLLKCGNIVKYIPHPIVIGFTTGIGITLLLGQVQSLFGLSLTNEVHFADVSAFITKIGKYAVNIKSFNYVTFILGVVGFAIIVVLQKINKKIPGAIIAIITVTFLNLLLEVIFGNLGVATIGSVYGEIKAEFYPISFKNISSVKFTALIVPTIVIAFLGSIESLLSATVADGMAQTKHCSNQELIGQGVANIGSALLGGFPATGAIARTAANINSGAKSSLAGIFHAIFVLIMYFALMGVLKYVPLTVFASVLISVAIKMSNFPLFAKLSKFGKRDITVLWVTCLLTVFFDLTYGVIGGVLLTLLVNIQNIKNPLKIEKIELDGKMTYALSGSLYFISAIKLVNTISEDLKDLDRIDINLEQIKRIDATAIQKLAVLHRSLKPLNKCFDFVNMNENIKKRLDIYFDIL